jgi:GNAT superfamily N-acetyltransferase
LLLARVAHGGTWHDAGAVGLRPLAPGICEMKRMYVRPAFRGLGLARTLAITLIDLARTRGYGAMRLDTVPAQMRAAERLYRELGFVDIPAYYDSPLDAVYLERDLRS